MDKRDKVREEVKDSGFTVNAANAFSVAIITGFDNCLQNGRGLTQLQQIDMLACAFLAYEDLIEDQVFTMWADDLMTGRNSPEDFLSES